MFCFKEIINPMYLNKNKNQLSSKNPGRLSEKGQKASNKSSSKKTRESRVSIFCEKRQEYLALNPIPSEEVLKDPVGFFSKRPPTWIKVFDYLMIMAQKHTLVHPSQAAVAEYA